MNKRRRTGRVEMTIGLLLIAAALLLTGYNFWDSFRAGESARDILHQLQLPTVLRKAAEPASWFDTPEGEKSSIAEPDSDDPSAENPSLGDEQTEEGRTPDLDEPQDATECDSDDVSDEDMDSDKEPVTPTEKIILEMPTQKINGLNCIGVLEVPVCKMVLPVVSDWSYDKLQVAPCVYTGSYYSDDLVICGHNYPSHFSPLKEVPLEADVYFTTVDGYVYHYIVDNVETVNPTEIERMIFGDNWDLTLFTCHTGGTTRCAVRCIRVYD